MRGYDSARCRAPRRPPRRRASRSCSPRESRFGGVSFRRTRLVRPSVSSGVLNDARREHLLTPCPGTNTTSNASPRAGLDRRRRTRHPAAGARAGTVSSRSLGASTSLHRRQIDRTDRLRCGSSSASTAEHVRQRRGSPHPPVARRCSSQTPGGATTAVPRARSMIGSAKPVRCSRSRAARSRPWARASSLGEVPALERDLLGSAVDRRRSSGRARRSPPRRPAAAPGATARAAKPSSTHGVGIGEAAIGSAPSGAVVTRRSRTAGSSCRGGDQRGRGRHRGVGDLAKRQVLGEAPGRRVRRPRRRERQQRAPAGSGRVVPRAK